MINIHTNTHTYARTHEYTTTHTYTPTKITLTQNHKITKSTVPHTKISPLIPEFWFSRKCGVLGYKASPNHTLVGFGGYICGSRHRLTCNIHAWLSYHPLREKNDLPFVSHEIDKISHGQSNGVEIRDE